MTEQVFLIREIFAMTSKLVFEKNVGARCAGVLEPGYFI